MRLSFWPTVFLIPALAVLVGLGVWQMQRLGEKTALIERIEAGLSAAPAPLPADLSDTDPWHYRRVQVEGVFLHEHELFVASRTYRGQVGLNVVTPLRRTDGQVILVNRGWIPPDRRDRATRADGLPEGTLSISGIARRPAERGWMQPDNDAAANLWFWLDLSAMAEATDVGAVPLLIVEADVEGGTLPVGGQTRLDIPNNHLQYAITWFAFAVILLVIFVLYHRRPTDTGETARQADGPEHT